MPPEAARTDLATQVSLVLTLAIGATLTGIIFMMTEQNGS